MPYNSTLDSPEECQKKKAGCENYKISDYCVVSGLERIKQEIFNYGPVVVVIPVYRDFLVYKQGVYFVEPGTHRFQSGHTVKMIGWDTRQGVDCWLVENSWGPDWGEDGVACIATDVPQLDMQRFVIAPTLKEDDISLDQEVVEDIPEDFEEDFE